MIAVDANCAATCMEYQLCHAHIHSVICQTGNVCQAMLCVFNILACRNNLTALSFTGFQVS